MRSSPALREGRGTVGKLLTDDALYTSAKEIAAEAEKTVANLREASEQAKGAVADFRGDKGPLKGITGDLQQTLASAQGRDGGSRREHRGVEAKLLVPRIFQQAGLLRSARTSACSSIAQGALETQDRRVLRIWIGAPVLFERTMHGEERLSDGGQDAARLGDVAVRPISQEHSPLVVEGYARDRLPRDERFLLSRRAGAARA